MRQYDYLIIGAGLFGSVMAEQLVRQGKRCLVIDKRSHVGGNIYTSNVNGITVHQYGAHIFHTNDKEVWEYINSFSDFNRYTNSPIANYKGKLYNLPFNMNTFYQIWGVTTPQEAQCKIEQQRTQSDIEPVNLEEQAISLVGRDIYEILIKGYTEKQWGKKATELPPSIIKRIPVRFVFDNNYFNDVYQGIPKQGYTSIIKKMLLGSDVILNTDYFERKDYFDSIAHTVIYTGEVDRYFNYCYGKLEYRSLLFETIFLKGIANYQGNAVVNYTDCETPYTRIIEHKHFEFGNQSDTMITKEFPFAFSKDSEPYYPINDERNNCLYSRYARLVRQEKNVYFGGRLAEYKYYNMDQVIRAALNLNRIILSIS
ncbi:UDP-galactopyranose mutase [Bacteroides thetaiotaomicron]|jgi:UDP-galactopyranose mutase|uniref:UDP-galactopyranose mutase n=1 Tax=Bacteroides thetaiotaomicron TaxID=818 RepID=UPI0015B5A1BF|nr:UDP-galactopyranose mutase [Bacteroides thetaiotaomicron]MCE9019578.1 UDP-galactopyranose mutase [Bacteroides thetaiotaomicron]MCS2952650.1 UDP-galactopyranose mutase [Bacteroides thetaiotaomicron]